MKTLTVENKVLVRQYLDQIVSEGNLSKAEEFLSPELVFTSPYTPEPIHGLEGFKQMIAMLHTAFPDLQIREEQMIAEDRTVAARWVASGTHLGNFMNLPPSGKRFEITGMSFYRLEDGKIVEGWVNDDSLGMLRQLGAIP
jgi:steroid delta-isomerase-like uncharacterized protein